MKISKFVLLLTVLLFLMLIGCNDDEDNNNNATAGVDFEDLEVDANFNYNTLDNITIAINVYNGVNEGIANIPFKVYDKDPAEGGKLIDSGATDSNGLYNSLVSVPTYLTSVFVMGYMSSIELPIFNESVNHTFGQSTSKERANKTVVKPPKSELVYLTDFNTSGVPLDMEFDVIPPEFLTKVDATLPERRPVPDYHPDYLAAGNQKNVFLVEQAEEVWVTFVHEGAGFKNSLGFYTYNADNPPTTVDDIDTIKVIFPNVSMNGSGGGLTPGDKVSLGTFDANTVIAWVLMTNGWYSNAAHITERTWYSDPQLSYTGLQQSILVYDDEYEKFLFGFEDLVFGDGDDDFNDAIFYASANPIEAVSTEDVPPIDTPDDEDGDGISDIFDDFPQDPERAFETNDDEYSTLAFEDLWPQKGDYDFNDLVIDYNFFFHKHANGSIKNLICEFELKAVGATKQNGFAVQFPFNSNNIEYINIIDGSDTLTYSEVISHPNFNPLLEDGDKAVINFVNNTTDLITPVEGSFINTEEGVASVEPVKFAVDIKFSNHEDIDNWEWNVPFNPFIMVDNVRGHEVHLPDYPPTDQVLTNLLGMDDDDSNDNQNRYYKTVNNHPWALNVAESWSHPYEKSDVAKAYLKFKNWAESAGSSYADWYLDIVGYRNEDKIYDMNE